MQYEPNFVEFPEDWGIDLPTQKRSEITIIPAQLYFKNTGDYARHVGKDGSWKVFIPTPKDIKQREEEIIGKERIRYLISRNNSIGWYWLVSVLIAATMGWIAAHNKYSKTFGFNS